MRLDVALVERGLAKSRTAANEIISSGNATVNGVIVFKPSFNVIDGAVLEALQDEWVGRGGKKLDAFLSSCALDINGTECLDVGASTGGFTQALLKYGAKQVVALDVGTNQLHISLKQDIRVKSIENIDVRDYKADKFDIVVCDLAFISIEKILADLIRLSKSNIIILFKPQFEVGKLAKRDRKGVVVDAYAIDFATFNFEMLLKQNNLTIIKSADSVLAGKEGNIERFYHITK
ncbi:MAG: hypothetical protein RL154_840 [Pseudomonadota bacterium]